MLAFVSSSGGLFHADKARPAGDEWGSAQQAASAERLAMIEPWMA
jgi:hypothetical protein